jgi:hypothetical protein
MTDKPTQVSVEEIDDIIKTSIVFWLEISDEIMEAAQAIHKRIYGEEK